MLKQYTCHQLCNKLDTKNKLRVDIYLTWASSCGQLPCRVQVCAVLLVHNLHAAMNSEPTARLVGGHIKYLHGQESWHMRWVDAWISGKHLQPVQFMAYFITFLTWCNISGTSMAPSIDSRPMDVPLHGALQQVAYSAGRAVYQQVPRCPSRCSIQPPLFADWPVYFDASKLHHKHDIQLHNISRHQPGNSQTLLGLPLLLTAAAPTLSHTRCPGGAAYSRAFTLSSSSSERVSTTSADTCSRQGVGLGFRQVWDCYRDY